MQIEKLLESFCNYSRFIKGLSESTIKRYQQKIGNFIRQSEVQSFDDITEEKVLQFFYAGRMERKWKATTYHTYYMTLTVFFQWAITHGHLKKNYVKDIELPKIPKSLPKNLSKQQADTILEATINYPFSHRFIRYRNHAIIATFIFAGIRKNELFKLTLDDVDIENRTLFINGKGNKQRFIPISNRLTEILERYFKERQKLKKTCPAFFTSFGLNKAYTNSGLSRVISTIRESSGIYFRAHVLRHTFATLMLEGGCDIYSLSKMMGHNDIKTTTLYLSASAEHLRNVLLKHPLEKNSF